ncbi:MAG TPA: hypothetical protein QGF63_00225 [Alphaproteobacteria bacterium]|jgi:hypothetical protein|nr:hypothetical protein [Alphaproteobacteria bacterium]MDP6271868.1 hypothetical protein [Alphaproteobacteria bacterium]MDP7426949.1 hypothetical protein [Alphaproteobacteria bacterium]HJM48251.1 hypothetical protein [Alphaproteobacteria bacterium]|tara:strand:+ start:443 stop:1138 length:696 start_codon:yes stop_codon:yes gene_type:complete
MSRQGSNASTRPPPPEVAAQLAALKLDPGRPLIISDADEVLFEFMAGFVAFIEERDCYFDWASFALTGNVRDRESKRALDQDEVHALLQDFFDARAEQLDPVPDAAEALAALAKRAQVVVLSNVPKDSFAARQRSLRNNNMDYPLIANSGMKGPAVRVLAEQVQAPVLFIDDIPHNHTSVARAAERVIRLHFVADPRLARLLEPAEDSHHRADTWPAARAFIENHLAEAGF